MGDMIDRVAEAICQADEQNGGPSWGYVKSLGKHAVNGYHDRARAAIEAMREPTAEMLDAATRSEGDGNLEVDARNTWQAMIDTALAEPK